MKQKTSLILLILLALLTPVHAQTILGKSPYDKVLPQFYQQNSNADALVDGLNSADKPVTNISGNYDAAGAAAAVQANLNQTNASIHSDISKTNDAILATVAGELAGTNANIHTDISKTNDTIMAKVNQKADTNGATLYNVTIASGNGGGLTGLNPQSMVTATMTNNGVIDSNSIVYAQTVYASHDSEESSPLCGFANDGYCISPTAGSSNLVYNIATNFVGLNVIGALTDGSISNARLAGVLQWNKSLYSPFTTPQSYAAWLHSHGFRWELWYEKDYIGNETLGAPITDRQQFMRDIQTILSWGIDILWVDDGSPWAEIASKMCSTNNPPVIFMACGFTDGTSPIDVGAVYSGSHWRQHSLAGDITSWSVFCQMADEMENIGHNYVDRNHHVYFGPEIGYGGNTGPSGCQAAMDAFSALYGADLITTGSGLPATAYTVYQQIRLDPANVAPRRVLQTNGCWVYLKPLKTTSGPDFALYVVNTNATTTTNISFTLAQLNNGVMASASQLPYQNYNIFDLVNATNFATDASSISCTLAPAEFHLFQLTAKQNTPLFVSYSPGQIDYDDTKITKFSYGNYKTLGSVYFYARQGLSLPTSGGTYRFRYKAPSWATSATLTYRVGLVGTTPITYTNFIGAINEGDASYGIFGTTDTGNRYYTVSVNTNNSTVVSVTVPTKPSLVGCKEIEDVWLFFGATNTTETLVLINGAEVIYR